MQAGRNRAQPARPASPTKRDEGKSHNHNPLKGEGQLFAGPQIRLY